MSKEISYAEVAKKYDPFESPEHPLVKLTTIPHDEEKGYVAISPGWFPRLFENNSHFVAIYQKLIAEGSAVGTKRYLTRQLNWERLLNPEYTTLPAGVWLYRQHRLAYPQKGGFRTARQVGPRRYVWHDSTVIPELRGSESPDLSRGYPNGPEDWGVNLYLALRLAQGSLKDPGSNEPFVNTQQLDNFAAKEGLNVSYHLLGKGLYALTDPFTIETLFKRGLVVSDNIMDLYQNIASWEVDITRHEYHPTRNKYSYPYPIEIGEDMGYPEIHFLPFIGKAYLDFMVTLPELIERGQSYELGMLAKTTSRLYQFFDHALSSYGYEELHLRRRTYNLTDVYRLAKSYDLELAQEMNGIYQSYQSYLESFKRLMEFYRLHPQFLNKIVPKIEPVISTWQSYAGFRSQLLAAGARAPRKPLYFKIKRDTQTGNV